MAAQAVVYTTPRSPNVFLQDGRAEISLDFEKHEQALTAYRNTTHAGLREHTSSGDAAAIRHW
ncbi:hypothetical protein HDF16_002746 [Granulicella aggregans]|uniref:Uncharacterized protein n=1 Tax=Granulicella aggregans TaxID=474949 RepID=A0A7W8E5B9_9BACT|nr:hypothetical protein [Granulicella aggregans]MBB5058040.1 hypothetical protein [Granulicella aggregans]